MNIFLLVECKSYKISINESALKQVSVYNKVYKSKNIMILMVLIIMYVKLT